MKAAEPSVRGGCGRDETDSRPLIEWSEEEATNPGTQGSGTFASAANVSDKYGNITFRFRVLCRYRLGCSDGGPSDGQPRTRWR